MVNIPGYGYQLPGVLYGIVMDEPENSIVKLFKKQNNCPKFVNFILLTVGPNVVDVVSLLKSIDRSLSERDAYIKINTKYCMLFNNVPYKTAKMWQKKFMDIGAIIELEPIEIEEKDE